MKIETDFDIFVTKVRQAYRQFCLDEVLHLEVKTAYYTKFKMLWDEFLLSLEAGYLLELAKLFEAQKSDTITIYYFLDFEFKDHQDTILRLKRLRNKFFAHTDVKTWRNPEAFMLTANVKRSEVRALFQTTIAVIDRIKTSFGITEDLIQRFQDDKTSIEQQAKDFIPEEYREEHN